MDSQVNIKSAYIIPYFVDQVDDRGKPKVLFLSRRDPVIQRGINPDGTPYEKELYPAGVLDLPGGKVEGSGSFSETPQRTATRELEEEAGILTDEASLIPYARFLSYDNKWVAYYLLPLKTSAMNLPKQKKGEEKIPLSSDEHREIVVLGAKEVETKLEANQMSDVHGDIVRLFYSEGHQLETRDNFPHKLIAKEAPWWKSPEGQATGISMVTGYDRGSTKG